jgi:hypothetical protein
MTSKRQGLSARWKGRNGPYSISGVTRAGRNGAGGLGKIPVAVFKKQGVNWIDYYVNGQRNREPIGFGKLTAEDELLDGC